MTISSKYQVVIPRVFRKQFNLKPGQKIMFIPYNVLEAIVETDGSIQLFLKLAVDSTLLEMLAGKRQL